MYTQSKYIKIANQLTEEIYGGKYAGQGMLPSIAQLNRRFECSQMTTRAALRILVSEGLVEVQQGVGILLTPQEGQQARINRIIGRLDRLHKETLSLLDDLKREIKRRGDNEAA